MFIQTEDTPNPNSLKFIPEEPIENPRSQVNYTNKEKADECPLAVSLFSIEGVESVFIGQDFITVSKKQDIDWHDIKPFIMLNILEFISKKTPLFLDQGSKTATNEPQEKDSEIIKQIKEIIEHRVRPAVAQDGGDIIFHSFNDGILKLELHGACSGCPSSTVTLKNGIENMIRHYVPEIESVEAI